MPETLVHDIGERVGQRADGDDREPVQVLHGSPTVPERGETYVRDPKSVADRPCVMVHYNTSTVDPPIREASPQPMDRDWNDLQPIYRQLHARIVEMILDG